ncbi:MULTISPECIES: response regulator transcription factor [Clostridium]|uniref:Stage 0 sporulation protein A homolog n=1 Tax=Clostridium sporogenes TaxID=1509 RepID=A0A7U4LM46_CLOSG|nr:response regulator transcription factor [Clostridium sporogenes]AVP59659.1 DNA-binding response regulator [Clostridium botulinum]AKC61932.1 putative transcriptional regulator [Clostridium sporogenes]AKJ89233.1 transcriptional regulator [Clostridium sporogenes]EHN16767.1 putative transcriptional regulator [Clostridium sporogenes PA 3679]KCZ69239.1 putative transcriptional regulator [Clostridium sporogenes]
MQDEILDRKILLIDDEMELLNLMETVLKKEGFRRILKISNGIDGVKLCKSEKPDIVVLDVMMPGIDGFETCKKIREFSFIPIVFLSAKSEDIDKILALGLGGDDYVTKPFSPIEVAYRIKAHLRRKIYIKNEIYNTEEKIINFGDVTLNLTKGEVIKNGENIIFAPKEYNLLCYMAENSNRILSKQMLCNKVWGDDFQGYDNTIMVHIRKLREKIEADPSNPKYILTVKGLGYKLNIEK